MNTNLIQDIKKHIEVKSTEELLDIWVEHDREKWSVEYFEAVRMILLERKESVPKQYDRPREPEGVRRNRKMRSLAKTLLLIGAGLYILISLFIVIVIDVLWPASPMIEILQQIRNILILLCIFFAAVLFILPYMFKEPQNKP